MRKHPPIFSLSWRRGLPLAAALALLVGAAPAAAQRAFTGGAHGPAERAADGALRFKGHQLHPDALYQPYMAGPLLGSDASAHYRVLNAFRDLLTAYIQRQGIDDNFTIRVLDNRNGRILEVFEMEAERAAYRRTGRADWSRNDEARRTHSRRLVDKYVGRGYPREAVSTRWGRKDEVWEARASEQRYIEYEMRLAAQLGLSLLATEIGTVETFNRDRVISTAGARTRYQMMPSVIRRAGIHSYALRTAGGATVRVNEEWHPLLTMEPAFLTLKGYANAVGHEIPGISAYHAGPGNLFKIYERYLGQPLSALPAAPTVADAYAWALTDGFDTVKAGTSFGTYSRGYVPAVYGSLKALEDIAIDRSQTLRAERVQLRAGRQVALSRILRVLRSHEDALDWGPMIYVDNNYDRFREMNPHFNLPAGNGFTVPAKGDVRLSATASGKAVRFFLPLGAVRVLAENDLDIFDAGATLRYDDDTYAPPEPTDADRAYERLVEDIGRFGFTQANRSRLRAIRDDLDRLAERRPTPYRRAQARIAATHAQLWDTSAWESLAEARGRNAWKVKER